MNEEIKLLPVPPWKVFGGLSANGTPGFFYKTPDGSVIGPYRYRTDALTISNRAKVTYDWEIKRQAGQVVDLRNPYNQRKGGN